MAGKVFVSGCFDLLHSGHVAFFRSAAQFGELYVGVGSDATVLDVKGKLPANPEQERLYMVKSIRYVKDAWISGGSGLLDFEDDLRRLLPDAFVVNTDGHSPRKERLCDALGIRYIVLDRAPDAGLPQRSSTALLREGITSLPYRVEIAGGWLDQPYVSGLFPGCVITASIEPTHSYFDRGGMSTSTRRGLAELFGGKLPSMPAEMLAKLAFRYDNGIDLDRKAVSGAQDAIGLCMPGLTCQHYSGGYWPDRIETALDEDVLAWLEDTISLYPLWPRPQGFDPTAGMCLTRDAARALAESAAVTWEAIKARDMGRLARGINANRGAQARLAPAMFTPDVLRTAGSLAPHIAAWKFTGAGGGGYLILIGAKDMEGSLRITIRRKYNDPTVLRGY